MTTTWIPQKLAGNASGLQITWNDGREDELTWQQLRSACPCANCKVARDKPAPLFTILQPEEARPVTAKKVYPLGNYAYQIDFSDGHTTGIYSLDFLRKLGDKAT